jgi:hypothetical protein
VHGRGGGWWNRSDVVTDDRPKPSLFEIIAGVH